MTPQGHHGTSIRPGRPMDPTPGGEESTLSVPLGLIEARDDRFQPLGTTEKLRMCGGSGVTVAPGRREKGQEWGRYWLVSASGESLVWSVSC